MGDNNHNLFDLFAKYNPTENVKNVASNIVERMRGFYQSAHEKFETVRKSNGGISSYLSLCPGLNLRTILLLVAGILVIGAISVGYEYFSGQTIKFIFLVVFPFILFKVVPYVLSVGVFVILLVLFLIFVILFPPCPPVPPCPPAPCANTQNTDHQDRPKTFEELLKLAQNMNVSH